MLMGLNILFMICVVLVPIIAIITGYKMKTKPPKEINNTVGYRTKRSKASQEAWDFANVYCGKNTFIYGIISLPVSIAFYALLTVSAHWGKLPAMLVVMLVQTVTMVIVMAVPTEMKLKEKFGE
jgi:uncharacterized membrane protein